MHGLCLRTPGGGHPRLPPYLCPKHVSHRKGKRPNRGAPVRSGGTSTDIEPVLSGPGLGLFAPLHLVPAPIGREPVPDNQQNSISPHLPAHLCPQLPSSLPNQTTPFSAAHQPHQFASHAWHSRMNRALLRQMQQPGPEQVLYSRRDLREMKAVTMPRWGALC